jgi:uncharacterized protein (DUF4213/DUF364 family)
MNIRSRIRETAEREAGTVPAEEVLIGLGYTAVKLADGRTGVAYTFRESAYAGCSVFAGVRPIAGKPVTDLLSFLDSADRIESALGLAAANAVANVTPSQALAGDVLDAVGLQDADRVGMVGFFGPLIPHLKSRVHSLEIFEENVDKSTDLLPAAEAVKRLPHCDLAFISATTIINDSVDDLLDAAQKCRHVIILGSSTPLLPEVFQETAVTCLSGIVVTDPSGIIRVIAEGGGTRFFKPFVQKWNIPLKESR